MKATTFSTISKPDGWRRVAMATWPDAQQASIYGWIDVDATAALAYARRCSEPESGTRVTLTHVVGKAIAHAFAKHPSCNAFVSRGRLRQRRDVDVFFSVDVGKGRGLAGAKCSRADEKSVVEIAAGLAKEVETIRHSQKSAIQESQRTLSRLPAWATRPLLSALATATYDLDLDLTKLGVPFDPFGTVIVTNVGTLGLEHGFAPMLPNARCAALFTVGAVRDEVVAIDGRPEVRPMITLGGTFDHRVVDGAHLGKIASTLKAALADPEGILGRTWPTSNATRPAPCGNGRAERLVLS